MKSFLTKCLGLGLLACFAGSATVSSAPILRSTYQIKDRGMSYQWHDHEKPGITLHVHAPDASNWASDPSWLGFMVNSEDKQWLVSFTFTPPIYLTDQAEEVVKFQAFKIKEPFLRGFASQAIDFYTGRAFAPQVTFSFQSERAEQLITKTPWYPLVVTAMHDLVYYVSYGIFPDQHPATQAEQALETSS